MSYMYLILLFILYPFDLIDILPHDVFDNAPCYKEIRE